MTDDKCCAHCEAPIAHAWLAPDEAELCHDCGDYCDAPTCPACAVVRIYARFVVVGDGRILAPDPACGTHEHAVLAAEDTVRAHTPAAPCGPTCDAAPCLGWALFDADGVGPRVERVDACAHFADDAAARAAAIAFFDAHAERAYWALTRDDGSVTVLDTTTLPTLGTLPRDTWEAIAALPVGGVLRAGGGAAPTWSLTRLEDA